MSEATENPTFFSSRQWKPYPSYKRSRVEWLGEVPEHWEIRKLKFASPSSSEKLIEKPEELPYIGLENVESKTGKLLLESPIENVDSIVSAFRPGDVLFGKLRPYLAKVFYSDFFGFCTSELMVLRPISKLIDSKYLLYLLLSDGFISLVDSTTYGAKMPRANPNDILNISICKPLITEQGQIAHFLDRETTRIDTLITKKRQLIDLLQKKRDAIIHQAVTKGLDPTVPLKDSGIPWIGQIPEHWDLVRLKWIAKTFSGATPPSGKYEDYYEDGDIRWVRTLDLNNDEIWDTPVKITQKALQDTACKILPAQTVMVAMYGGEGTIGKHGILRVDSTTNQAVCGIVFDNDNPEFMHFYMKFYRPYWMVEAVGTRRDPNISQDVIRNVFIPLPKLVEQLKITNSVNKKSKNIQSAIHKIEDSISDLNDYRQALITSAVTGKIDVREEAKL